MTVVNPKSISGITSITTASGSDNLLTIHTNDGTERVRVDSAGTTKVGSGVTLSPDGDIFATGVTTSTTVQVGSATTIHTTGIDLGNGNLTGHNLHSTGITTSSSVIVGGGVTISESGIEASGIGITVANINDGQISGRRNIIINGAMKVAQRGTSFTNQSEYTMDRFKGERSTDGAATITQSTTAPDGFKNSLKYDITTADTSLAAGQYAQITYRVEGQDLQHLAYGTSSAKTITLSFYVRSNKTGNYNLAFEQPDNGDNISSHQYTINSADTWERKVITTAGDTSGVINDDNGSGLAIKWGLAYGSTYSSGSVTNGWAAQNNANFGAGQDVNLFDSTSNEFYLTGIQLEVGPQATSFEHRSFNEELTLCQRYYQSHKYGAYIGFNFMGRKSGSNTVVGVMHGIPPMRAAASGTFTGAFKLYRTTDGTTASPTGMNVAVIDDTFFNAVKFTASTTTYSTGNLCTVFTGSSGGQYDLDAEI